MKKFLKEFSTNKIYLFGFICLLLIFNIIVWFFVVDASERGLEVVFLNIGQGDAIFIETPSGNQLLIDGGPNSSVLRELGKVMPFYDRSIDVVLATHPDQDHIGGLPEVFKRFKVDAFISNGVVGDTETYKALEEAVLKEGANEMVARSGQKIWLDKEVYLDVLYPTTDVSNIDSNTGSIIVHLVYDDFSVMLTGDSPVAIENYLVGTKSELLKSDILKAGHHGSRTSSSESFVKAVSPSLVVISAGLSNKYGHPHQEVVDLLDRLEIETKNTALSGRVTIKSDGKDFVIE